MQCIKPMRLHDVTAYHGIRIVPCGRCIACRINKTSEWVVRLELAKMTVQKTSFVTLTYDDEHLPKDTSLCKRDLQLFFKRLRKNGLSFSYFAVGEYGEKEQKYYDPSEEDLIFAGAIKPHGRPHYHILFFGQDFKNDESFNILKMSWKNCSSDYWDFHRFKLVGNTDSGSIRYVCDYMQKKQYGLNSEKEYFNALPPFSLCSQKLGLEAFMKDLDTYKEQGFIMYNGRRIPIPRYFRKKFEIEVDTKVSENNFYRQLCLEKGLIKREDLKSYDLACEQYQTNVYKYLVWINMPERQEEIESAIRRHNALKGGKI